MYDEITLQNGLDPEENWIPICSPREIVRCVGQTELSNEQYEEIGRYARDANFWDDMWDEMDQLPLAEQGKIALEWMGSTCYYGWLEIPGTNQEMLYELVD